MTKTQIIKRLKELSLLLGRELNITGTDEELALRLQEAEVEAEALKDENISEDDAIGTQNDGTDSAAVINGPNPGVDSDVVINDPASSPVADPVADDTGPSVAAENVVVKYAVVRMLATVSMPALARETDAPVNLLLKGETYRVPAHDVEPLRRAKLIAKD